MVGINSQFISEMVWRDLPVARDCTPLRMFWGAVDYKSGKREADIEPLREWAKAPEKDIGDLAHQTIQPSDPQNTSGSRLVIVFRSDLFRRYPGTLVYLFKPLPEDLPAGQPPDALDNWLKATPDLGKGEAAKPPGQRRFYGPTFVGGLTPEVTFFAFDVRPETLNEYWLMLGEPPAELRFRNGKPPAEVAVTHSAGFCGDHDRRTDPSSNQRRVAGGASQPMNTFLYRDRRRERVAAVLAVLNEQVRALLDEITAMEADPAADPAALAAARARLTT